MFSPLEYISSCYEVPVRHATFDDSGGKQDGAFIYVGLVAPKAYWDRFNSSWDAALAKFHLPYLHTSKFIQSIPILGNSPRTNDDAYTILDPFIEVIKRDLVWGEGYTVIGITTSDAWSGLTLRQKKVVRQPQIDCFESAIGLACASLIGILSEAEPIAIQVDESNDIARLAGAYTTLKKDRLLKDSLGAICFANDKKLRSIQAADLIAHLVLRQWRKSKMLDWDARLVRLVRDDHPEQFMDRILFHDCRKLGSLADHRLAKERT